MFKVLSIFWATMVIISVPHSSRGSRGVKNFFKALLHHLGPGKDAVFKLHLNSGH